ncbi:MAG: bifunctional enzyme IspD/IspF, partial [Microbacterium sp.]|nr:bifunctional enzyme IspD/IspF [Microbacterium sp.]
RPVVDTLKRVTGRVVDEAVDRAPLVAAQTPQGFPRALLEAVYAGATEEHTDDTALFAAAGHSVHTVAGDDLSFKITTPADLDRARHLLRPAAHAASVLPLVGIGTDVHAFGGDGALRLAGLEWPGEPGLRGHSDGDAVAHAIVDAVLAAAGLGDIGTHFGVDRPEYAGASGVVFLRRVRELVAEAGFAIGNVSVQVQAIRPRFAPRRAEAEAVLTAALGAPVSSPSPPRRPTGSGSPAPAKASPPPPWLSFTASADLSAGGLARVGRTFTCEARFKLRLMPRTAPDGDRVAAQSAAGSVEGARSRVMKTDSGSGE